MRERLIEEKRKLEDAYNQAEEVRDKAEMQKIVEELSDIDLLLQSGGLI
jgi:hypothetical protein